MLVHVLQCSTRLKITLWVFTTSLLVMNWSYMGLTVLRLLRIHKEHFCLKKCFSSEGSPNLCWVSVHVLPISMWVSSEFSDFLPWIGYVKYIHKIWIGVCVCAVPWNRLSPIQGVFLRIHEIGSIADFTKSAAHCTVTSYLIMEKLQKLQKERERREANRDIDKDMDRKLAQ